MPFEEKLGISILGKLKDVTETFVEHGIKYLEYRITNADYELIKERVRIILEEKDKSGIITRTVHLPHREGFDLSDIDEEKRVAALENHTKVLNCCYPLQPEIVVLHPSAGLVPKEEYAARKQALVRSLKEFTAYCKNLGITVAVENLTEVSMVQTSDDLLEIVEAVGDNIGICFDVNHLLAEPHKDFIRKAGKYIITMHVSDNDGIKERHFLPGDGVIDWKELFAELKKINYQSTMIVECGQVMEGFPDSVSDLCEKWEKLHK